jgi:hypothetical protein
MNVLTQHNDNSRTGANLNEVSLNTSNVNPRQFGKIFTRHVVGAVYAQPLYVRNVRIPRKGTQNVVYVATMYNFVYAFDADNPAASAPLWGPISLGPAIALPDPNIGGSKYRDMEVEVGIVGTPVISTARNALYVVAATKKRGRYSHHLHKLSLSTGQALRSPVRIASSVSGLQWLWIFQSHRQLQRAALLLAGNVVYVAFASYGDKNPYHGWMFGYHADSLRKVGEYVTTPLGRQGGIWQAGQGPAADEHNNLYFMTGNGTFRRDGLNLSTCMVKLRPNLRVADWFSPYNNWALGGDKGDHDLGSAGVLLLSGTNLVLGGGKEGKFYLVDRNHMGKFHANNDNQIVQSFWAGTQWHHIHGSPVYWHGPKGRWVYVWPENETLRAFKMLNGKFQTTPISESAITAPGGMPGGILSISARGRTRGSGIVWASHPYRENANQRVVAGIVRAYDASDLRTELWNSKYVASDDIGNFAKFCPPTVANGRVYMASMGGIQNKVVLKGTAIDAPALINFNQNALAVAWTGTDRNRHLNVICSTDGQHFTGKVTLQERSPHGPGFTFGNGRAFLAWTDSHHHLNMISSPDCKTFTNKVTLADTSPHAPALGFGNGRLFIAWTGFGSHRSLNVMSSLDGVTFTNKVTPHDNSPTGPALAFFNGKLYLLWVGTDSNRSLNIFESTDGVHFKNKVTFRDSSDFHPALASTGMAHLVWTGRDSHHRLNLMISEDNNVHRLGRKATYPALQWHPAKGEPPYGHESTAGMTLAVFQNQLYAGWTGADRHHHINVASLSRGHFAVYGLLKGRPAGSDWTRRSRIRRGRERVRS